MKSGGFACDSSAVSFLFTSRDREVQDVCDLTLELRKGSEDLTTGERRLHLLLSASTDEVDASQVSPNGTTLPASRLLDVRTYRPSGTGKRLS